MKLLILIVGGFIFVSTGCGSISSESEMTLVSSSHVQMGTQWNIKMYTADTIQVKKAIRHSWQLLDSLNAVLSNFEVSSDVSNLSYHSGDSIWVDISKYTADVISKSRSVWSASQGGFDITIAPVMKLWRRAFKMQLMPSHSRLKSAQELVGMEYLQVQGTQARLLLPGMSIDLGGIGKGYAVDLIFDYLSQQGYDHILVEGGGDLRIGESPPNQRGWIIESESINERGELSVRLDTLINVAVATSGNRFQFINDGADKLQHHINPSSGEAVRNIYQVVVHSEFCWKADAISTAISILGSDKIDMKDYAGYLITGNDPYKIEYFKY